MNRTSEVVHSFHSNMSSCAMSADSILSDACPAPHLIPRWSQVHCPLCSHLGMMPARCTSVASVSQMLVPAADEPHVQVILQAGDNRQMVTTSTLPGTVHSKI